ncbi:hypothetical protein BSPLISOX_1700 [uncultured Gammaproteobacteria bacterium]|nr:hypothetical protein BSPLISOX_1700 [uncultured Gammaproteobacteria bacterium]
MSAFNQLTIKPIVMVLKVLFDGSFNEFIKRILRKKENFADEVMAQVKG